MRIFLWWVKSHAYDKHNSEWLQAKNRPQREYVRTKKHNKRSRLPHLFTHTNKKKFLSWTKKPSLSNTILFICPKIVHRIKRRASFLVFWSFPTAGLYYRIKISFSEVRIIELILTKAKGKLPKSVGLFTIKEQGGQQYFTLSRDTRNLFATLRLRPPLRGPNKSQMCRKRDSPHRL